MNKPPTLCFFSFGRPVRLISCRSVIIQKELLSPPRAIQTPEELFLLIKIFDAQGRHEEIVSLLNSKHLGIESRIAQNDWSFVSAKIANLENAGLWDEALSFTRELLALPDDLVNGSTTAAAQEKDDWRVWSLLLAAAEKLGKKEYVLPVCMRLYYPRDTDKYILEGRRERPRTSSQPILKGNRNHGMLRWLLST